MERLLEFIGGALPQEIDPFVAFSTLIIALFSWGDHMLHPDLRESIKNLEKDVQGHKKEIRRASASLCIYV